MNLNDLRDLYRHMEWADAAVWGTVLASPPACDDQKLREYFYHLHLVQRAFLRAWRNEARDQPYPTFDNVHDLMLWGHSYFKEVFEHFEGLTDEQISQRAQLPWADIVERELGRKPQSLSLSEMMLQVPMHSQYHRGQINARLRAVGGEPARVDYIVWVWLGRPDPVWELAT